MSEYQKDVRKYYRKLGSRIGYRVFLSGSKHFGFYPSKQKDIPEDQAQQNMHEKIAGKLDLSEEELVLDAGCGEGVVAEYLAEQHDSNVAGITLVPFEARTAQERNEASGTDEDTAFFVMDYSEIAFPDDTFDAVFTTESLCHSPDINRTLGEIYRVLEPGGRFAFFEYTFAPWKDFSEWQKKIIRGIDENAGGLNYEEFRHGQFGERLRDLGFEDVEEKNINDYVKPSFWWIHLWSVVPYMFVMLFGLQHRFPNTTIGYEFYKMGVNDQIRYCIFSGRKPS